MKLKEIYEDKRGTINILTGFRKLEEVAIFQTLENYARGGCIHYLNDEYIVVIEGTIAVVLNDDEAKMLSSGDSMLIRKATPHYFLAMTDCVVMEWGATSAEKEDKHIPTRKIVEDINAKANRT